MPATRTLVVLTILLSVHLAPVGAQSPTEGLDVVYLKFDDVGAPEALNWARTDPLVDPSVLPESAVFRDDWGLAPGQIWGDGYFGQSLRALDPGPATQSASYDLPWPHHVTGDLTVAMYVKRRRPVPASGSTILEKDPLDAGLTIHVLGNQDLVMLQWHTGPVGSANFYGPLFHLGFAPQEWTHIAWVIDRATSTYTYYLDGVAVYTELIVGPGSIPAGIHPHRISPALDAAFDIDEFRISERAVPAEEILRWATEEQAGLSHFGERCGPVGFEPFLTANFAATGGPALGNSLFRVSAHGLPGSTVTLGWGLGRQESVVYGVTLPYDLGALAPNLAGCHWRTSADLLQFGVCDATGRADFPVPIPYQVSLVGFPFYGQCLLEHPMLSGPVLTNAIGARIGYSAIPAVVATVTPSNGTAAGGTLVTVKGRGFDPNATVFFDGIEATNVTVVDGATITCVTPFVPTFGPVDVTVSDSDAAGTLVGGYDCLPILAIDGLVPPNPIPGQIVKIQGFAFSTATTLVVDGVPTTTNLVSVSELEFLAPASAACGASIVLANPDGMTVASTFNHAPVINALGTTSGPAAGGQIVVITGSEFAAGSTVTFGGAAATILNVTPGILIVLSPPGTPGPTSVVVTNPYGCSDTASYTYL